MTLIVVSALGETPDALYEAARKAAEHADWIEIRLDTPSGLPWDLRSFFSFGRPCIATVRHCLDGGRSEADDSTRAAILRRAMLAGAQGIDIEVWSDEAPRLIKEARAQGIMVIASRHLDNTPPAEALLSMLREARALGADHAKVATRIEKAEDAVSLLRAADGAREEGLPFALMAVNDPFLRVMAPSLGMSLVYASVPGGTAATSGQVPADLLRSAASPRGTMTTGATRPVFLLGHPVAHSKSPQMHNAAFTATRVDAHYLALDVEPEALANVLAALKTSSALGCNVTLPHKEAALALVDSLDPSAREAGAVNTIVFGGGHATGHNTDGAGAIDALRDGGVKLPTARALILGAGGAARAVAHALAKAGAEVTVTNRTPPRAIALGFPTIPWERIPDVMHNVDLLVNATSIGLHGERVPVPLEKILPGGAVFDCVPGDTPLMIEARERGLLAIRGEAMLLHQGARAFELWTQKRAPIGVMRQAVEAAR
jgi:shikimate dehydrogenase/3-dehydroquinate dehydratase type I